MLGIISAGLFLTHYRLLAFLGIFVAVALALHWRSRAAWQRVALATTAAVVLTIPWLVNLTRQFLPRLIGGATLAAALLSIMIGAATAHEFTSKGVTVSHPWARATPGGVKVGGAYFEVKAAAGQDDRLIGARSTVAGSMEVHSHAIENGIAKMRKIDGLPIKGGQSVVLKPGGYHVMLLDLKQPLKEGDLLKFTLTFEKAGDLEVEATVEPRATHHIPEIIAMIERLVARGHAYVDNEGHVLFHVPSDPRYGTLSHRSLEDMIDGARVEIAHSRLPKARSAEASALPVPRQG